MPVSKLSKKDKLLKLEQEIHKEFLNCVLPYANSNIKQ
jgi:hypothetical protein